MIVVTGAAGFAGSCLIKALNESNFNYIIAADDFFNGEKEKNLQGKKIQEKIGRDQLLPWLERNHELVEFIFHMETRSDHSESKKEAFDKTYLNYSKSIWNACCQYQIPLLFITPGEVLSLDAGNPYSVSKNSFDVWITSQNKKPFFWAGLRTAGLYGPNESHQGKDASVVYRMYNEIQKNGQISVKDNGAATNDLLYIKDLAEVIIFFMHHRKNSGFYTISTGALHTDLYLAKLIFRISGKEEKIISSENSSTAHTSRSQKQSDESNLSTIGYDKPFTSPEDGLKEYLYQYLMKGDRY